MKPLFIRQFTTWSHHKLHQLTMYIQMIFSWALSTFYIRPLHLVNKIRNIGAAGEDVKNLFISSIYKSEPVIYALSGLFLLEWTNESLTTASWIDILTNYKAFCSQPFISIGWKLLKQTKIVSWWRFCVANSFSFNGLLCFVLAQENI